MAAKITENKQLYCLNNTCKQTSIINNKPMHCKTSITKKQVLKYPLNQLIILMRKLYPIPKSNKPLKSPFFILGLSLPFWLAFNKRQVKTNPEMVKNVGAVIPLK